VVQGTDGGFQAIVSATEHVPAVVVLWSQRSAPSAEFVEVADSHSLIRRIVEAAHVQAKEILTERRESLTKLSEILIKRETIEKEQFESLLAGGTEEEVFGAEAPPPPEVPLVQGTTAERAGRDAPRPLPRPGLAGGTAE